MSWLDKIIPNVVRSEGKRSTKVPEGLWEKCVKCDAVLYKPELEKTSMFAQSVIITSAWAHGRD